MSNERIGFSANLPCNFPGGYFQLCGDGYFVRARHVRRTPARELPRTQTGQNDELERGELSWTVYHGNHILGDATSRSRLESEQRIEADRFTSRALRAEDSRLFAKDRADDRVEFEIARRR